MPHHPSDPKLTQLQADLGSAIYTAIQTVGDVRRLVCASIKEATGEGRGNSFWVAFRGGRWFVVTWAPRFYRCPSGVDILELCRDCLFAPELVRWKIDARIPINMT
jgi:hypothetical protein